MISTISILRKAVVAVVPTVVIATVGAVTLTVIRGIAGVGPESLSFLGMLAAGIATGHVAALLAVRRWLSPEALTNQRSMLAGALGVLFLFGLVVLGPDFPFIGEAAWRRLRPLEPFIQFGIAAVCGGLGAVAMYFPWLRSRRTTLDQTELAASHSNALLTGSGLDEIEVHQLRQDERVRPRS